MTSVNLTTTIFVHLPQFAIMRLTKPRVINLLFMRKIGKIILDYFFIDWEDLLKINELNVNNPTQMHVEKISILFDTYAPLKRIDKSS